MCHICATESKAQLSAEYRNRKSIVPGPSRVYQIPPSICCQLVLASDIFQFYPHLVSHAMCDINARVHSTRYRRRQCSRFLGIVSTP